ncbi:Pentatricopeptide repeat (PPR) superfamily protein, putative [Theobroma cacao]|uniref:Pentatricopeptide repeat (PPR) superfamily protein, putative n=1 Tax=Theobroma cacao TaxID=3641 RepID=A0A061G871_THECC|nr:Pentatricopeptide repeat (PPR) superfamily protein, putative [Theobroma cacao]
MNKRAIFPKPSINKRNNKPKSLCPFCCSSSKFSSSSSPTPQRYTLSTCIASIQSCFHQKNLTGGKQLHAYMLRNGFLQASPASLTSLINMYSKCNQMTHALSLFQTTIQNPNIFSFNAIISGFVTNEDPLKGLNFYREMRVLGVLPDKYTFPCLLKGCCDIMEVLEVRKIHGLVFKLSLDLDLYVGSGLVKCYLKFLFTEDAEKVFDELLVRDVVLWNAMVNGYAQVGRFDEALGMFRKMCLEGVEMSSFTVTGVLSVFAMIGDFENGRAVHGVVMKMGYDSSITVSNALIDMYGKCKFVGEALEIFKMMAERDIFSWNSIMSVHVQCGDHDETLRLFGRMLRDGIRPDLITLTTVFPSCTQMAALMHGRVIHGYMIINGLSKDGNSEDIGDVLINNGIMDMYAKCGSMREAYLVFDKMSHKDVASWNILIMGYGMHGFGSEALDMFSLMCESDFKPDDVTFVGVLSACSHGGFVSLGRQILGQMKSRYGVVPTIEHYTCVVDMLGRAGQLEEAYQLALTSPTEANAVVWRALLAACRLHGNSDMAEVAAKHVFQLEPEHCGSYVLMSNVYVAAGKYEEVLDVRNMMRQQNVRKLPGCSWIELKNGVHAFINGDCTHPGSSSIYDGLHSLTALLHEHDYVPDL